MSEENANEMDNKLTRLPLQNMRIRGYLQSYKYFYSVSEEVRQEYIFQDSIANEADGILHDLHAKYRSTLFVGVHVRRGDFLRKDKQALGYGVPQKSYFMKAFLFIKSKFPHRNITFVVGSDDLNWCHQNLIRDNVIALPDASPAVHMAIMSSCDHMIISGGSFGWWSAWLSSGYVVYFTGFMEKGTIFGDIFRPKDYYLDVWIGLGN